MASQTGSSATFQEALAQHHTKLVKQFEDESVKRREKHERQKLDLLDEVYDLKQKLRRSASGSEEIQRLRDENTELARQNADLERKAALVARQAQQYKQGYDRYKEKFRSAKERILEWQSYADRHSPGKRENSRPTSSRMSAATSMPTTPFVDLHQQNKTQEEIAGSKKDCNSGSKLHLEVSPKPMILLPTPEESSSHDLNVVTTPLDRSIVKEHSGERLGRDDPGGLDEAEPGRNHSHKITEPNLQRFDASGRDHISDVHIAVTEEIPPPVVDRESVDAPPQPMTTHDTTASSKTRSDAALGQRMSKDVAIPSSQSTDEEEDLEQIDGAVSEVNIKQEASPVTSSPIVVSERQLKRKARNPAHNMPLPAIAGVATVANGSATKPVLIKEEQYSIVEGISRFPAMQQVSSIDLDEVVDLIDTPRKRLRRIQYPHHLHGFSQRMGSNLGHVRATSVPLAIEGCENHEAVQHISQRLAHSFDGHSVAGIATRSRSGPEEAEEQSPKPTMEHQRLMLQPMSPSRQNMPAPGSRARYRRGFAKDRDRAIEQITEDGESVSTKAHKTTNAGSGKSVQDAEIIGISKNPGQRIQTLLQSATSSQEKHITMTPQGTGKLKRPSTGRISRSTEKTTAAGVAGPSLMTPVSKPAAVLSPKLRATEPQPPRLNTKSPPKDPSHRPRSARPRSARRDKSLTTTSTNPTPSKRRTPSPSHEPLSARPLHRLTIHDFKINPAYNNGLKYAYDDTVRRFAEKACLPGCTDPRCCGGHFRRMVELGIVPGSTEAAQSDRASDSRDCNSAARPSTTEEPEAAPAGISAADLSLLITHLGGGASAHQQLHSMSATQRANALVDAKAADIAQRFGKHRRRNERRRTPPGFWDAEVPDTQKLGEQRRVVEEMEREEVGRRWREAMRGFGGSGDGKRGRWLFRDE